MVSFPPSKINLGLHVLRKRADGYHDLETCFYPVPWTDVLEIIPADSLSFTSSGTAVPGRKDDNLCLKAYRLLAAEFDLPPVSIHLHKIISTGAGLGGGSADAAYTLRLLNDIFSLNLSPEKLIPYAAQLGSDCAFFVQDKPKLGTGRGEILHDTTVSLRGKFLVLLKPDVHVSTAEAYAGIVPSTPAVSLREILENNGPGGWRSLLKNDFEESVFRKYPVVAALKEDLYQAGALYASMSGSGAAVFGIFEKEKDISFPEKHVCWKGMLP